MNDKKSFEDVVKQLEIGSIVSFPQTGFRLPVKGEVRDYYFEGHLFYIIIYCFFTRKDRLFILTRDLRLVTPSLYFTKKDNSPVIYEYEGADHEPIKERKAAKITKKIIIVIILITFVLSIIPDLKIPNAINSLSYDDFLNQDLSLNELYIAITGRLRYRYDLQDEWMTPHYAWKNKYGDCEEFASIFSEYLSKHNIENYLTGLDSRNYPGGHAVVFAVVDGIYHMIDPTGAIEPAGIKALPKVTSLQEAVRKYNRTPAAIYKVPAQNGEKQVLRYVSPYY